MVAIGASRARLTVHSGRMRGQRASTFAPVLVLIASTAVLSCRQIVGITDDPPHGSTTTACGLPFGTNACASCASASCCAESSACAADSTCSLYESCLGDCNGDPACRSHCAIDHPVGTASDVSALSACLADRCESDCGLRCGALAGWQVEPDAAVACANCLAANACSTTKACATSVECDAIHRCILACPTLDCMQACQTSHGVTIDYGNPVDAGAPVDSSGAAWSASAQALNGVCASACATGGYWECVGKVSWPVPKSNTATIHFWAKDYSDTGALADIGVSVCDTSDVDCSTPARSGATGPTGEVSLAFANINSLNRNLGFTGYLKFSSQQYLPGQLFWGFPLSEPDFFLYGTSVTPASFQAIIAAENVSLDPSRSALNVVVFDCLGSQAPDVTVNVSSADGETIVNTANLVRSNTTDSTGTLLWSNVPTGPVTVTATPMAIGRPSSIVNANVQGAAGIGGPTIYAVPTPMP
jgi:hypothetical protein